MQGVGRRLEFSLGDEGVQPVWGSNWGVGEVRGLWGGGS